MQSLCKENYDATWEMAVDGRCPNLIRNADRDETFKVNVSTQQSKFKLSDTYDSLADMWSQWNLQYFLADFPRLIIRFEDMLFRQEEVTRIIGDCVGLPVRNPFKYRTSVAKYHGVPSDYLMALEKYSTHKGRHRGLNEYDRKYAQKALNQTLMETFGYAQASVEVPPEDLMGPFPSWWASANKR